MSESYIYGIHAVEKFIQQSPEQAVELLATERRNPRLLSVIGQARKVEIAVGFSSRDELSKLVGSDNHQSRPVLLCIIKYYL